MSIWVVGTTRNEVDLVRVNVEYHRAQGVDRFLLLDNGSTDGTTDVLQDLARTFPLEWAPYRGPFHQHVLLTRLAREAVSRGADWVIPVDADEFWSAPGGTLREALSSAPAGKIQVPIINFVQHRGRRQTTPDALLGMTRRVSEPIGPAERAEEFVESEQIAYVEHVYQHKWISSASSSLRIDWGNHIVDGSGDVVTGAGRIVCLHAPLRSFEVLQAKIDAGRPSEEVKDYFDMAWHLRRWRRMSWENRLEEEWHANSYDDDGALDVHGVCHPLTFDDALRQAVQPWIT